MYTPTQLLICDDDPTFHLTIKQALKAHCECKSAYHSDEALVIARKQRLDLVLLDVEMRSKSEGLQAIGKLHEADPQLSIVMSSGRTDFETVREAMRLGAADYIPKDSDPETLWHVLSRALERKALIQRTEQQSFEVRTQQNQHLMIGESSSIQALRKIIGRVRQSPANVVIYGETGTGKEVVARQLRKTLPDGSLGPFVAIDSATIQGSTAESLLFGHEKGAFTGAEKTSKGLFEEANGGIIYFDEIANMPLSIQVKLLRVIQEKEFVRLGSSKIIQSDFRVICATNRDLEAMVRTGEFKDDLLQRLNVLPIDLPPLRDRREDIPLLVEHFLSKPGSTRAQLRFTPEALEVLKNHSWPGNIRELGNLIAYVVTMTDGDEVDISDLPPKVRDRRQVRTSPAADVQAFASFYDQVSNFERGLLFAEYQKFGGNISKLALHLGMDRSHLYTKLKEHEIHPIKK